MIIVTAALLTVGAVVFTLLIRSQDLPEAAGASPIQHLEDKKGDVTDKTLEVSMDMSARSTWESSITAHLNDMPFDSVGKGEQCRVQMKLAIEAAGDSNVLLIEEPENHLSHSNMHKLIEEITQRGADRQIILTTHSNFVLNKLGIDNLKLLSPSGETMIMEDLSSDTKDYFMKLPGYDTLRLILSSEAILVEGPSDALIVPASIIFKICIRSSDVAISCSVMLRNENYLLVPV